MAPKGGKRKSGAAGGGGAVGEDDPDSKKGKTGDGPTLFEMNALPWWSDAMIVLDQILACGSVGNFFNAAFTTPEARAGAFKRMSDALPGDRLMPYATNGDFTKDGQKVALRPYMMGMGVEFGNKGLLVHDSFKALCQLVLVKGFLTDGENLAGVEKLMVTCPNPLYFNGGKLPEQDAIEADIMLTQSVACVKGWTRCQAWLAVVWVILECNLVDKLHPSVLQSFTTAFGVVKVFAEPSHEMDINRGAFVFVVLCV